MKDAAITVIDPKGLDYFINGYAPLVCCFQEVFYSYIVIPR